MSQIMVFEPDEIAATGLKKAFADDTEVRLVFISDLKEAIETLNGNPADKSTYSELQAGTDAARKEFQTAANAESSAKSSHDNAAEISERLQNEKAEIKDPATETKDLESEITARLGELKNLREAMLSATRLKAEKEKAFIALDAQAELAKARIPTPEDQIYGVFLIASQFILPNAKAWLESFRKQLLPEPNSGIRIVILGFDAAEKTAKKYLIPGISDYMIKPIDELLARQNLKSLTLGENKAKREVYSLKIKDPVDLIFEYELEGLSENSFVISSKNKFEVNEFRAFNCEHFLRKNQISVLGKCLNSTEKPEGGFTSEFWFVGMDTHLAFQIKNLLKAARV